MKNESSQNANQPRALQHDGERIQEDDLDVEDDEEHRGQVEADREALCDGGPVETPDSNGSMRARLRWLGLVANANDITTMEAGIRSAKAP